MRGKRDLLAQTLETTGLNRLLRRFRSSPGLVVLNYHRIGERCESLLDRGVWSAGQEQFDRQVEWLTKHCDLIGVEDLDEAVGARRGRHVLITFDDGYVDNYAYAFPVLKRHNASALFFVTAGFLDQMTPAWWDEIAWMIRRSCRDEIPPNRWTGTKLSLARAARAATIRRCLETFKRAPGESAAEFLEWLGEMTGSGRLDPSMEPPVWMTWDMLREMHRGGMDVGAHTMTHPVLSHVSPERQWEEIFGSKRRIEDELAAPVQAFSYPVGHTYCFDAVTRDCLQRAGFRWAFTFHGGFARPTHTDRLAMPRVPIDPELTPARIRSLISLPELFA